jgi:hypothetical protein
MRKWEHELPVSPSNEAQRNLCYSVELRVLPLVEMTKNQVVQESQFMKKTYRGGLFKKQARPGLNALAVLFITLPNYFLNLLLVHLTS